ncbi:MAG: hypothetical protein NTX49_07540 [Chlamydiae bacterium]|nr:hypothetical protein [Chlamydiota bacterium]
MTVHLSRGFATVAAAPPEPYLQLRSYTALGLGIVPFAIHTISREIFKAMAHFADYLNREGHTTLRKIVGVFAVPAAAVMLASAKVFSKSQELIWGHYVRAPEGRGVNARLAWYGADHLPWQDMKAIATIFFNPENNRRNDNDVWTLRDWSQVGI